MTRRKAIGRGVTAVVAIMVIIVSVLGYISVVTAQAAQAQVFNCPRSTLECASEVSSQGLQLQVTINSSSIQSHEAISAQIKLLNTLGHNNSLTVVANQNISSWNGEDFLCNYNPSGSLVGFTLFKGHFSAKNISASGPPLQLATLGAGIPCGVGLNVSEKTTFLPDSDKTVSPSGQNGLKAEVYVETSYCGGSELSGSCGGSSGLLGYWNSGAGTSLTSSSFAYFPPGEYTISATDDWDQYVYVSFNIL